jgi:hypothetical protein
MSRLASEKLARTFAVIGLCVAVLVATLDPPRDVDLSGVAAVIGAAALAGFVVGRLRSLQHVLVACVTFGWFLAIGVVPFWVSVAGARRAAVSCVGLPLVVLALALVGRSGSSAARSSVLDRSSRRALVATAAAIIAAVACATVTAGTNEAFVPLTMAGVALMTTGVMLVSDLRTSLHVHRARGTLDFGAGEQAVERREEVPASYRTTAVVVHVESLSRAHAMCWITRAIVIEILAVAVAGIGFGGAIHEAMTIEPPRPALPRVITTTPMHSPKPCVSAR